MHEPKEPKSEKAGKYEKYEVESWARTVEEAAMIKADPEKMKHVKECLEKKAKAITSVISSIDEIKEARQNLPDEDSDT